MTHPRKVALLVETSNAYGRELLHGIRAWLREHPSWTISLGEAQRGAPPPAWLKHWKGDGIIARIETQAIAEAVVATKLPVVDLSAARLAPRVPWMETNDRAIARLAVEHLQERGFRNFAYCGDPRFNWSQWRGQAFVAHLASLGFPCHVFGPTGEKEPSDSIPNLDSDMTALVRWIKRLPRPVAIFACYDIRGMQVLEACRYLEVHTPDEVAVLGVDNDELLCDLADPPLSSIIPDGRRTGYEAAAMLDRLMGGERLQDEGRLFDPRGVAVRLSTDVIAVQDRHIAAAVRYIRENACTGITVSDIVANIPLSRRVLETRFRKCLGCSPHDQILRVKLDRVKRLLIETDLPLSAIADRTGFAHVEYLSVAFKKHVGRTASEFRQVAVAPVQQPG